MSTHPRIEPRVSALERRQTNLETRVEEVTEDATTNFKQISSEITASFKHLADYTGTIEDRFDKIGEDITIIKATMATKEEITGVEKRLDKIETTMLAMENRILDAFKQLTTTISQQRPPAE